MRLDPAYRPITADEFFAMDFGTDKRFELDNGAIYMMTGGTEGHAWVQANIVAWLRPRLRGTGCRVYGPDMAVRTSDTSVRYPDVSIYCRQPPRDQLSQALTLGDPTVVIEVLSPTTTRFDQGTKLEEYRSLPGVQLIAFVDPVNELVRTIARDGRGWLDTAFAGANDLPLSVLQLTIPHAEIFARD